MSRLFEEILYEVQYSGYAELPRYLQIRVEKWIEKLAQPITNKYWVQNRNEYARLLLHCIVTRNFREPFDKNPQGGPLPSLPSHLRLAKRGSPRHTKFWDRIHRNLNRNNGHGEIKPRGNARWRAIAPTLFRPGPEDGYDGPAEGTEAVDAALAEGRERRLRQLHIENQHLRTQVQHLARQRAAEAVEESTTIVTRTSPQHMSSPLSPTRSVRHHRSSADALRGGGGAIGGGGEEAETTVYTVTKGVDSAGDPMSTTVLRKTSSSPRLLSRASSSAALPRTSSTAAAAATAASAAAAAAAAASRANNAAAAVRTGSFRNSTTNSFRNATTGRSSSFRNNGSSSFHRTSSSRSPPRATRSFRTVDGRGNMTTTTTTTTRSFRRPATASSASPLRQGTSAYDLLTPTSVTPLSRVDSVRRISSERNFEALDLDLSASSYASGGGGGGGGSGAHNASGIALNRTLDSVRKQQRAFKDGIAQSTTSFMNYLENFEKETKQMLNSSS